MTGGFGGISRSLDGKSTVTGFKMHRQRVSRSGLRLRSPQLKALWK